LPATKAVRRDRINLRVALANALTHTKGYATPETKAALAQARLLIEKASRWLTIKKIMASGG